jgi:hypothetical protein
MAETDYKKVLEQAKRDLLAEQEALGGLLKQQEASERKVMALRQTIAALSRMLDEEFVEEDAMGLTDAVRDIFTQKVGSGTLTTLELRDYLVRVGYDITKYGNVMANIHSVITRLLQRGEISEAGTRADNKVAYKWNYKIEVGIAGPNEPLAGPPNQGRGLMAGRIKKI